MIITIDGPAGCGKSTAARKLAAKLKITYLDTGATYRALTLKALRAGVDLKDEQALKRIAAQMDLKIIPQRDGARVILDGQDITSEIRSQEVTENSHYAARSAAVRGVLAEFQRRIGRQLGDFVSEGRDQGSVVFPEADIKFYLDADPKVRAERRRQEMLASGQDAPLGEVLASILARDRRDRSRAVSPLIKPKGAIVVDTTHNTIEKTAAELLRHVEAAR